MQDHIFIDIKIDGKTGEISAIRTNDEGKHIAAYSDAFTIQDDDKERVSFKTAINGFESIVLKGRSERFVVVCHFMEYARTALHSLIKEKGISDPFVGRSWVDIGQLAWPLFYEQMITDRNIATLARYYGIDDPNAGTSDKRCYLISEIYFRMMRRYAIAQRVESGVRGVGGNLVEKVLTRFGKG